MGNRNKALDPLELRLRAILPEEYQDSYEEVQPVSMGSAGLRFGADGKVAWNDMWATFCDLAMAGGPPHKGMLLEPGSPASIDAVPDQYGAVVEEICRGVSMVTGLNARRSPAPGWVRIICDSETMASWLLRAIVMENVAARADGRALELPAGPHYRVDKEIKNVITVIAKTCHYWTGHMFRDQKFEIGDLFETMARDTPLVVPAESRDDAALELQRSVLMRMADEIQQETGLSRSNHRYASWLGLDCKSIRLAVWMMRIIVVSNVLSRREGTVLFVPVNPPVDPIGARVAAVVVDAYRRAVDKRVA